MYNKLQYISQGNTVKEQLFNIHKALDNGCDWIQMRFKKNYSNDAFTLAEATKILCDEYLANFIVNDNVYLAQQIAADGVHLGMHDMKIEEARLLLGKTKIIGATANTIEDVFEKVAQDCDYIGLGPFQFTTTKAHLSPVLGLEGYRTIIQKISEQKIGIPIYAIGGITLEDVESLLETGIHGIAISGLITKSKNPSQLISQLNEQLYATVNI
jgi:thiamine-phosphate pyrophosphorylase